MTIQEAKQQRQCHGCVYRLIGPGPLQCMGAESGAKDCPGRVGREELQPKEEA